MKNKNKIDGKMLQSWKEQMYYGILSDISKYTGLSVMTVKNAFENGVARVANQSLINGFFVSGEINKLKNKKFIPSDILKKWKKAEYYGIIADAEQSTGLSRFIINKALKEGIAADETVVEKLNEFYSNLDPKKYMSKDEYIKHLETINK